MPIPGLKFSVPYTAIGFPAGVLNSPSPISFGAPQLVHALIVTGRAPGDRLSFGLSSFWEFMHRTAQIKAYLRRSAGGRLTRSRLALALDRSEKVALSYSLGQAITGVFCSQVLNVIYLMHIDRYSTRYNVVFSSARSRPDLFGQASYGWVVAEAKGRTNGVDPALINKAKAQKRSVSSINGAPPALSLGCVASFPGASMQIDAFDPEDDEIEAINPVIDEDRFVLAYYEPFVVAIDQASTIDNSTEGMTSGFFPDLGTGVGLVSQLLERVRPGFRSS